MPSRGEMNEDWPEIAAGPYLLRKFQHTDLPLLREAAADPYIPLVTTVPSPFTREAGEAFIERQWQRPARGEGYSFAIAHGSTGQAAGLAWASFANKVQHKISIGYWIVQSARGAGAATHALRAISKWTATLPEVDWLELYIEPWNAPSRRTAEKVGYRCEQLLQNWQTVSGTPRDMLLYRLASREIGANP